MAFDDSPIRPGRLIAGKRVERAAPVIRGCRVKRRLETMSKTPTGTARGLTRRRTLQLASGVLGVGAGLTLPRGRWNDPVPGWGGEARAEGPVLVISTENTEAHVQTRVLRLFAERAEAALNGAVRVEVVSGAALYRDRDVPDALAGGRVAMAAPGTWHLGQHVPDFNIPLLPMFYGQPPAVSHALVDGDFGRLLSERLEKAIGVHVLGRFIDLGQAHVFTRKVPVASPDDFGGLRIRVAGGRANQQRLVALGAEPILIPWPELPEVLRAGQVDGALTTAATVVSAELWIHGLDHACLDQEYFPQYVPMVSGTLWSRLPPPIRDALTDAWESVVAEARSMALDDQAAAIVILRQKGGMTMSTPSWEKLGEVRQRLMGIQDGLIRDLKLDPGLVAMAKRVLP